MTSEGLLFTAVCDTNAASPSLGGAAIISFGRCINLVGYFGKNAAENLNWYTPQFTSIGKTTTDINAIQLDDGGTGMVGWGDVMQIADPFGSPAAVYMYYDKSMNPAGEAAGNFWGDDQMNPVDVSFDKAAGFAFDNANAIEFKIVDAGEVISEKVQFSAQSNLNWFGNPFPVAININAIQLDDGEAGMIGWGDVLQVADPFGSPAAVYMYYDKSMNPAGEAAGNFWGDDQMNPVNVMFQPGEAFAIDNANEMAFDIIINCPYSL